MLDHLNEKQSQFDLDLSEVCKEKGKHVDEETSFDLRAFSQVQVEIKKYAQPSRCDMTIHFTKLMCPSVITSVGSFLIFTINTIFAGQFENDSAAKLAGVGVGSMMLSMIMRYVLTGMNCAQETLVPEAYGQR